MTVQCSFRDFFGNRCKQTKNLNRILILGHQQSCIELWGCLEHTDDYIRIHKTDIQEKIIELDILKNEIAKSDKLDRLYELTEGRKANNYEFNSSKKRKEEKKKHLNDDIKYLRENTCRRSICRQPIDVKDGKGWIEIRSPNYGKVRENFPFHEKCLFQEKGLLGLLPTNSGQKTLEGLITMTNFS